MTGSTAERIAIPDLQEKLQAAKKKVVVVDVREKKEVAASGRISGALHIPLGQLEKRMGEFARDQEIVFYCGGGGRASRAAAAFHKAGYANAKFCGLRDWKKAGLPTTE